MNTTDFDLIFYQREWVENRYSQNFSKAETGNNQTFGVRKTTCRASRHTLRSFSKTLRRFDENAEAFCLKCPSVFQVLSL